MASEKVTEVEMEEITPAEEKEDKEAGKGEKEPEEKVKKNKEEEDEEDNDDQYSKLNSPTEDIYSLATHPTSPPKLEDVYRKVILYRRLSAVLLLICVLLLAVLLALAVKLSEAKSSQECPTNAVDVERTTAGEVCSRSVCEAMYPPGRIQAPNGHACSECGRGWLKFEDSCYFLSQTRLNWLQSREQCKKMGGDLVVISNERVQRFLTQNGLMMYWIGLSRSDSQQWTWINNTVLMNSYWSDTRQDGDCVFLNGGSKPRKNWYPNQCAAVSHYICQKS
ncbi:CD209 antigen-like protein E isoform X1 [Astyanax mexicanus]|uniref:CD209 antigen-like protein E isoform X1 n=1 Tax=Astyanax mexicanus TaxID=7994 RepID=UPI0020CB3ED1|nr:CD209 antigen-like protein E isoform X1 [Astyanax mexicanus]